MNKKLQITLALLKPDVAGNPIAVQSTINKILSQNLTIVKRKVLYWKQRDSSEFYKQHEGKFFYQRLVEYTTCGPLVALLLVGQNAIQDWRDLMGPTKTFKANLSHPYSLRGEFGLTDTRNSTHGSDSVGSVNEEIQKIFPEFDMQNWLENKRFNYHDKKSILLEQLTSKLKQKDEKYHQNEDTINSSLGLHETWSKYFKSDERDHSMEWFIPYSELQEHLLPMLYNTMKERSYSMFEKCIVLDIGCGNSMIGPNIAKNLADEADVYCVDFAMEALTTLQAKMNQNKQFNEIQNCFFVYSDVTQSLPFKRESVSVIIDKGTTDAILRQPRGRKLANEALCNMLKVLHRGGVLIQITDEDPEIHVEVLELAIKTSEEFSSQFSISWKEILHEQSETDASYQYFLYSVKKS